MQNWGLFQLNSITDLKGIVHPKVKIQSSFIHTHAIPNLYECFFFLLNSKDNILKNMGNQTVDGPQ